MPVTRQAVAKHLGVLERAELVVPRKDGREVRDCVASRRLPSRSRRCDRWIDTKRTLQFAYRSV
jgi:DNA-binding transcriptional ArsR family regulator